MTRVALRLAYEGAAFDSYARQPGRRTVEGELLTALAPEGLAPGSLRTGSRTDAGVSALENVVRADLGRPHLRGPPLAGLVPAVQRRLPPGLWLTGAAAAPPGFDPRRAAWRQYLYLAPDRGEDAAAVEAAAAAFEGTHHMAAFARLEAGRDPRRTVASFTAVRRDGLWRLRVRGPSFLWGQVRRMAAAALAVGQGLASAADVRRALATGRPHPRFGTAPAAGLVLERVHYEGLEWDPEAGGIGARRALPLLAAAQARLEVAVHLARLASLDGPGT